MNSAATPLSRFLGGYLGVAVFLVAVVFRGLVGWALVGNLDADPDAYAAIARSIERSGVYGLVDNQGIARPTAFRPPLYPWLLAKLPLGAPGHRGGVLILHALLGGWTALATFLISRRFVTFPLSIFSAALVAVDPILLMQSTLVMTETLATALSATVLWWCARMNLVTNGPLGSPEPMADSEQAPCRVGNPDLGNCGNYRNCVSLVSAYVALGVLLALSYLCRPTFLVWAVLLVIAWASASAWRDRWANWRPNLFLPAIVILIVATGVSAWTVRNWQAIGHPVWATTHGGYTLLLGNNPHFYEHLKASKPGAVWDAAPFLEAYQNRELDRDQGEWEFRDDRRAYEAAKAAIASEPKMFVYSCFVRLARLWSPMPHQVAGRSGNLNIAVAAFYVAVFLMSILGLFKLRRRLLDRFLLASLTLAMTLSLVHSVYWSNMRMRAPLTPALAVLSAVACLRRSESQKLG